MHLSKLIIFLPAFCLFSSCEKKADADFSTDKTEYVAGETVKLTNTSKSGSSFVWIMPNGEDETTKNAEYIIPLNQGFDQISFNLTAKSKAHCKRDSKTISVNVIPSSWWTISSTSSTISATYIPYQVNDVNYSTFYRVDCTYKYGIGAGGSTYYLNVWFPPGGLPPTGTYTLQTSSTSLSPYTAFVNLGGGANELPPNTTNYISGVIQVEYINSKLHIYFTDITDSGVSTKLSASIYKP